jgi:hypothetical protein
LGGCAGGGLESAVSAKILYGECHVSQFDIWPILIICFYSLSRLGRRRHLAAQIWDHKLTTNA